MYSQVITVKDQATDKPLELVSVYNSDPNRSLLTNSNGKVDISKLDKDKKIIFRLIGYEKIETTFNKLEKDNFVVLMKSTTISLDNVVVTTNRWEENRSEIPNTVKVISPQDVDFQNPQTTADMLGMLGKCIYSKKPVRRRQSDDPRICH